MPTEMTIGTSSGNKTVSEMWVGTASGNKFITEVWVGTASGNKQVFIGVDDTPDAVNWANIGPTFSPGSNANQTISSINVVIQLSILNSGGGTVEYSINGGGFISYAAPFNISNGNTLRWQISGSSTGTITVINDTDGATVIDTFTYDII